jgi:hypothetical protein
MPGLNLETAMQLVKLALAGEFDESIACRTIEGVGLAARAS